MIKEGDEVCVVTTDGRRLFGTVSYYRDRFLALAYVGTFSPSVIKEIYVKIDKEDA